jgi:hypothetical protein
MTMFEMIPENVAVPLTVVGYPRETLGYIESKQSYDKVLLH